MEGINSSLSMGARNKEFVLGEQEVEDDKAQLWK